MRSKQITMDNITEKNELVVKELTKQIIDAMKGRYTSFQRNIEDHNGEFSHEKLVSLIDEIVSSWKEAMLKSGANETALANKVELYKNYLYIAMRSSLVSGLFVGGEKTQLEHPDFAYILDRARELDADWCVMKCGDRTENVPFRGFTSYFGAHLYPLVLDVMYDKKYNEDFNSPEHHTNQITETGHIKGSMFSQSASANDPKPDKAVLKKTADVSQGDEIPDEMLDAFVKEMEDFDAFVKEQQEQMDEQMGEYNDNAMDKLMFFRCPAEYIHACECFEEAYRTGDPAHFYEDIEMMVDLYLYANKKVVFMDTDDTLHLYDELYRGYRLARKYAEER